MSRQQYDDLRPRVILDLRIAVNKGDATIMERGVINKGDATFIEHGERFRPYEELDQVGYEKTISNERKIEKLETALLKLAENVDKIKKAMQDEKEP